MTKSGLPMQQAPEISDRLPAICFHYFIFPFVSFTIGPPFAEGLEEALIASLRGKANNEFLIMFPDPQASQDTNTKIHKLSDLLNIGVVASLERSGNGFIITGRYRANILKFEQDKQKKKLGWVHIEKRPDIPTYEEIAHNLQHSLLPMLLGCTGTILRLLKEIYDQIIPFDDESAGFKNGLAGQIRRLKNELREPYAPYQICWYVSGITLDHISDIYKAKILKEDSVVDRLQTVIEVLQLEKRILALEIGLLSDRVGEQDEPDSKGK